MGKCRKVLYHPEQIIPCYPMLSHVEPHVIICHNMLSYVIICYHMLSYVIICYIYISHIYIYIYMYILLSELIPYVVAYVAQWRGALPGEARAESCKQDLEEAPHVPMYDVWKKFRRNMEQIWNKCRHMNENNEIWMKYEWNMINMHILNM